MNSVFIRFCVLQGAYWSFYASLPGYIAAYMLERGVSAATLGGILSANLLCSFLGSLFWGRWVDAHQASRRYYLIGNAAAAVLGCLLFRFAGSVPVAAILYPLFGFMTGPVPTTLDAWVIASFPDRKDAAGRSRSFATLSYAFVMLIMGQIIARRGYGVIPYAAVLFIGISILVALAQPEYRRAQAEETEAARRVSPKRLLSSGRFVLLVAAMFFTGMSAAPINNMKIVVLNNVGGDVALLGWDAFIGCIIQAQFLIFSGKLRRIPLERRLLIGTVAPLFYALLVAFARHPYAIVLGTIMNNVSFGILFPAMREMTEESVSPMLRNTAHGIIDVAYGSLSGMIATAWSGVALQLGGSMAMGCVCAALQCVAIALCMGLVVRVRAPQKA